MIGGGAASEAPDAAELASRAFAVASGVAQVLVRAEVTSTMDEAHALGRAGAPSGTVVVADRQVSGRGRGGRHWQSERGAGVWVTVLERPATPDGLGVLSVRLGLRLAAALEPLTEGPVRVKWPNDLHAAAGKLGGILVEARWRGEALDWVAVGLGVNLRAPSDVGVPASAVRPGASRSAVLHAVLPVMRGACAGAPQLTASECAEWSARDLLAGRRIAAPHPGWVAGITPSGALRVREATGGEVAVTQGSVVVAGGA